MARVKHKAIKRLIYDNKAPIDDIKLFTSKELKAYMQDILDIISCAYDTKNIVRVELEWNDAKGAPVAWTDSEYLHINAGTYMMKDVSERSDRFEGVLGLLLHENGHLLYSNFIKSSEINKGIMSKRLLMVPSKENADAYEAYEKCQEYISLIKNRQILGMVCSIWNSLSNALEDGHVDWRIGERYPGYKPYLDYICDLCYDIMPSVSDVRKRRNENKEKYPDEPVFLIYDFLNYLLLYSRYGFLKGEEWEIVKEEAALQVYDLIDYIDMAKECTHSIDRLLYQSIVFYKAFPYDYFDDLLLKFGNEDNSVINEQSNNLLQEALNSGQASPKGISSSEKNALANKISGGVPVGDAGQKQTQQSMSSRENNQQSQQNEQANSSTDDNNGFDEAGIDADVDTDATKESGNGLKENSLDNEEGSGDSSSSSGTGLPQNGNSSMSNSEMTVTEEDRTEEENKQLEEHLKNIANALSHSQKRPEKEREKGLKSAQKDMQRVLDKINKNTNLKAREKHLESELNTFAASVKHSSIHDNVTSEVRRIDVPSDYFINAYDEIWPQLKPISKKLQGKLQKQLEKQMKGYRQKNLYFGRKLETSALTRGDGKCFSKNNLPRDKKKLAVALLVDESGSMSLADRITHARMASLIVYDFCTQLGIPVAVYGHSAGHTPDVRLNAYAEFDAVDKNDKYRIMCMDCNGCNRDGYALRYVADRLNTQNSDAKLLFIISDGKPADTGYHGDVAYEDLASIKKEYRRKGIVTIAAAIGNDKDIIETIYGKEAFLDVTDLNDLPENLISIVKSYL